MWSFSGVWSFSPISAVLVEFGGLVGSRVEVWSFSGREMTSSFTARRSSGTDQAR